MNTTTATASTSRKLLIPLATLAVAGAVAVGTGADWSASTDASVRVTSGKLLHTNNQDVNGEGGAGATLVITNIKPGDTASGVVEVENTGTVKSVMELVAAAPVDGGTGAFSDALEISIELDVNDDNIYDTELYSGPIQKIDDPTVGMAAYEADFDPEAVMNYKFTVELTTASENADQNKTITVKFDWNQTEGAGETLTGSGWL